MPASTWTLQTPESGFQMDSLNSTVLCVLNSTTKVAYSPRLIASQMAVWVDFRRKCIKSIHFSFYRRARNAYIKVCQISGSLQRPAGGHVEGHQDQRPRFGGEPVPGEILPSHPTGFARVACGLRPPRLFGPRPG